MLRDLVARVVDASSRHARLVLLAAVALIATLAGCAGRLELRSDLLQLLPRDSPRLRALEHQLGRAGGASALTVIVESPDRGRNEAFVDDLASAIDAMGVDCRGAPECAGSLVSYVESRTTDVRAFFEANKWLYADTDDLRRTDAELDRQIALRSGLVEDLDSTDDASSQAGDQKPALGMTDALARWKARAADREAFPSGYFATPDGRSLGLRVVSSAPLGDPRGDRLLRAVRTLVDRLSPASRYHPAMRVGFTGDIASAAEEKSALLGQAAWASALALVVVLAALVLYYRSVWALGIVGLPALFGVAAAYAFAELAFGYVNACGAFLGAIILGNGVNYPIVLLSRYGEFRRRGMPADVARREAVVNALRAELVGACVAAIAYGSLFFTRFRGFRQFGAVGFVGMLAVWVSMVPIVPAAITLVERLPRRLHLALRGLEPSARTSPSLPAWLARSTTRHRVLFVCAAGAVVLAAAIRAPSYLRDPWEYDLGKLGSRQSDTRGAGRWSDRANEVFGGKMNVAGALVLADRPDQVPALKQQILANDARDPQGPLLAEIATIDDLLPGTAEQQKEKLAILDRIRSRLTPRVLGELDPAERRTVEEMRPPDGLRTLAGEDLPPLLRRRFTERDGRVGTILYVKPRNDVVLADGHNQLRLSRSTDNVRLPDGELVMTASRSSLFADMLDSMRHDGPLASLGALSAVTVVVVAASRRLRVALSVLAALGVGVAGLLAWAAWTGVRIHYVNFIALPITLGIGCEYPFNIADRVRLLEGDVASAVERSAGAVAMCSFTTMVGYGALLLSDFRALASFGELAVVGEAACLFAAVGFLPALLGTRGFTSSVNRSSRAERASACD
jgi:predicted RND superfamily exporter protein